MRKVVLLFLLLFINVTSQSLSVKSSNVYDSFLFESGIEDGWYEVTVDYTNFKTGTIATYTLTVGVVNESVEIIEFGKGGSVYSGYNHEGYVYSGGELEYETDSNGNIVAATTTVTVSDHNGIRTFEISIE